MLLLPGVCVIPFVPTFRFPILALVIAGSTIAGCDRQKQESGQAAPEKAVISLPEAGTADGGEQFHHVVDRSHAGNPAPTASFKAPDDSMVTLAQFRGRPLLVNLWATWCAPCVAEMPTLDHMAARMGKKITVLAVAQDLQGTEAVDPWFQKAGLTTLQPYLDPQNVLLDAANSALPTTILYDAGGKEIWRVSGAMDWQGAEAKKLLAEAQP